MGGVLATLGAVFKSKRFIKFGFLLAVLGGAALGGYFYGKKSQEASYLEQSVKQQEETIESVERAREIRQETNEAVEEEYKKEMEMGHEEYSKHLNNSFDRLFNNN